MQILIVQLKKIFDLKLNNKIKKSNQTSSVNSAKNININAGSFFYCQHGQPEHHHCSLCEKESKKLPSFFDE